MEHVVIGKTPAEVARALNVSVELVRQWLRAGKVAHIVTPYGRLVPEHEVERLQAERQARKGATMKP